MKYWRARRRAIVLLVVAVIAIAITATAIGTYRAFVGLYSVPIGNYTVTDDPQTLVLVVETWQSADIVDVRVHEEPTRVTVTIRGWINPNTFDYMSFRRVSVRLTSPLRDRLIVDGATGTVVSRG